VKEAFSGEGLRAIGKLCLIYIFIVMFWALFDQMDSAWVLQAEQMDRHWLGHDWLPSQIVAANPFLIMLLIPFFSYAGYPLLNRVFRLTPLRKISIGLFVMTAAYVFSAWIQSRIDAGGKPSIGWMFIGYVILTSSEVMVSITSLEFSYTQAPRKIKSFIMAIYLLSISVGNAFTAGVNAVIKNADGSSKLAGSHYFLFFAGMMLLAAVVFIPFAASYKEKTYIQDES